MAQTTVSGVLFENELRKMVSTLVWHNKYLGDKYDKESRSLVLEFEKIGDAIKALNILPFGINYNIYLLDA